MYCVHPLQITWDSLNRIVKKELLEQAKKSSRGRFEQEFLKRDSLNYLKDNLGRSEQDCKKEIDRAG